MATSKFTSQILENNFPI